MQAVGTLPERMRIVQLQSHEKQRYIARRVNRHPSKRCRNRGSPIGDNILFRFRRIAGLLCPPPDNTGTPSSIPLHSPNTGKNSDPKKDECDDGRNYKRSRRTFTLPSFCLVLIVITVEYAVKV